MMEDSGLGGDPQNRTVSTLPLANNKIDLGKAAQNFRFGYLNDAVERQPLQIGCQLRRLFLEVQTTRARGWP